MLYYIYVTKKNFVALFSFTLYVIKHLIKGN
jgi:hypothetical protein